MLWIGIGIGIGLCVGSGVGAPAATGNLLVDGNPILVDTFPIVFS